MKHLTNSLFFLFFVSFFSVQLSATTIPDTSLANIFEIQGSVSAEVNEYGQTISHSPMPISVIAQQDQYISGIWFGCLGDQVIVQDNYLYNCDSSQTDFTYYDVFNTWTHVQSYMQLGGVSVNNMFLTTLIEGMAEMHWSSLPLDASASVSIIYELTPIPEPSTILVFAIGLFYLIRRTSIKMS